MTELPQEEQTVRIPQDEYVSQDLSCFEPPPADGNPSFKEPMPSETPPARRNATGMNNAK